MINRIDLLVLKKTLIELFYNNAKIEISLIFILALIIYCFCYQKQADHDVTTYLYKYKINNFIFNNIYVTLYIAFYCYLLFIIRTRYLNKEINLYQQYLNIKNFCTGATRINTILIILVLILTLYILLFWWIKINQFFLEELTKKYIIFITDAKHREPFRRYHIISIISIGAFCVRFTKWTLKMDNIMKDNFSIELSNNMYKRLNTFYDFLIYKFPTYFIIAFFFHQMYFNHFKLSQTFNQALFIYSIYIIYKRFCNFFKHTEVLIDQMLYNMYYKAYTIKYVNLPEKYKDIIYHYVSDGLYRGAKSPHPEEEVMLGDFSYIIAKKHTYWTTDGIHYFNKSDEFFVEDPNNDKDIL